MKRHSQIAVIFTLTLDVGLVGVWNVELKLLLTFQSYTLLSPFIKDKFYTTA